MIDRAQEESVRGTGNEIAHVALSAQTGHREAKSALGVQSGDFIGVAPQAGLAEELYPGLAALSDGDVVRGRGLHLSDLRVEEILHLFIGKHGCLSLGGKAAVVPGDSAVRPGSRRVIVGVVYGARTVGASERRC